MDNLTNPVMRRLVASYLPNGTQMAFFSAAINPRDAMHKSPSAPEIVPINAHEKLYYNLMHGDPDVIVAGMQALLKNNPAGFCLNCGCPRNKIQKTGHFPVGVRLMEHPGRVAQIVGAAKKEFPTVHFSVKIRIGMKHDMPRLFSFCSLMEEAGADAIIFHARSAEDQYTRPARHELFGELKKRLRIPLIGNGDIQSPEQAHKVMKQYCLDGLMIGRGALLTPAIFRAIALYAAGQAVTPPFMTWNEKHDFLFSYAQGLQAEYGSAVMLKRLRLLTRWFSRGVAFGQTLYGSLQKAKSFPEIEEALIKFFETPKAQYSTSTF